MEEASNASSPVSILASLSYVFALLVAIQDPDGLAAQIATFLPPVSPMVVPLRAALGAIEPWEIGLAVIVNLAAIGLLLEFGGRVYSGAVLQTAGRIKLRDAWRAVEPVARPASVAGQGLEQGRRPAGVPEDDRPAQRPSRTRAASPASALAV